MSTDATNEQTSYQVTEYSDPDSTMDTQWGRLSYLNWLGVEIKRWQEGNFREAWVHQDKATGHVAMWSLKEYQRPVENEG